MATFKVIGLDGEEVSPKDIINKYHNYAYDPHSRYDHTSDAYCYEVLTYYKKEGYIKEFQVFGEFKPIDYKPGRIY